MKTVVAAVLVALALPAAAFAHAEVSPPVTLEGHAYVFTLAVPTEQDGAVTTKVELTPPAGFNIDSFVPAPGWKRTVSQRGSGDSAVITKVTWSGGNVPTGEDSAFSFLAAPASATTYDLDVRQTYSDGTVVDWNGPESSDTPAPTVEVRSSFGGGGGGSSTLALVVGAVGVLLGAAALFTRGREVA